MHRLASTPGIRGLAGLWAVSAVVLVAMLNAGAQEAFDRAAVLLLVAVLNLLAFVLLIGAAVVRRRRRRMVSAGESV
jgi:hypothetical protein